MDTLLIEPSQNLNASITFFLKGGNELLQFGWAQIFKINPFLRMIQLRSASPHPSLSPKGWLCSNMKKTDILEERRGGRVEKI